MAKVEHRYTLNSQTKPRISRTRCGMSVVSILETINPVITAPYCIWVIWVIVHRYYPNYEQHLCFVQFLEYRDTLSWHCERIDTKHMELARLIFCMSNTRFSRWKHLTAYCWCTYRVRCYGSFSPFLGHVQTVSVISSCREVCIYGSARTWKHLRQYRPFVKVTNGFPTQRISDATLWWCFCCWPV